MLAPYILHPAPYILRPTPYALHPTPYALQPKIKIDFFYDTLAMLAPYSYSPKSR
jgi:hypothetical protein